MSAFAKVATKAATASRSKLLELISPTASLLPCRICALEPVLAHTLARPAKRGVFATFSALPSHDADFTRAMSVDLTPSAASRLVRIAERAGLNVTESRLGPVAYGFVTPSALEVLKASLRTLPSSTTARSSRAVSIAWSLVDNTAHGHETNDYDIWDVAAAI